MKTGTKTATFLMFSLLALAGCGTSAERGDYRNEAGKGHPLDMPPDLVVPRTDARYVVPEGGTEKSATYSEYAKLGVLQGQTCVCQEAASQPAAQRAVVAVVPPKLQARPDGSNGILIAEPFDRCWLRVGQAIDAAGIEVQDKDRSKGLLYLKGGNQLSVQGKAAEPGKPARCEVSAANASGAATSETKRIIDALYGSLSR